MSLFIIYFLLNGAAYVIDFILEEKGKFDEQETSSAKYYWIKLREFFLIVLKLSCLNICEHSFSMY